MQCYVLIKCNQLVKCISMSYLTETHSPHMFRDHDNVCFSYIYSVNGLFDYFLMKDEKNLHRVYCDTHVTHVNFCL